MNQPDSTRQNKLFDYLQDFPVTHGDPPTRSSRERAGGQTSPRLKNPLVPPACGSDKGPFWWRRDGWAGLPDHPQASGRMSSVAGDMNTFSAKVTAMLVPILLVVFILAVVKDYSTPPVSTNTVKPATASLAGGNHIEVSTEAPKPDLQETPPVDSPETPSIIELQIEDIAFAQIEQEQPIQVEQEEPLHEAEAIEVASAEPLNTEPQVKPEEITVKGILYSRDNPSAIIGDKVVHIGDTVLGATVVGITKDTVLFERIGQKWSRKVQEAVATP